MIPISKNARLKHVDTATGITYEFKPLIGEAELILQEAVQYFGKAGQDVDVRQMTKHLDLVINAMLTGWSGGPEGMPEFTENPAECFGLSDKKTMLEIIMRINGLSGDEKKN